VVLLTGQQMDMVFIIVVLEKRDSYRTGRYIRI